MSRHFFINASLAFSGVFIFRLVLGNQKDENLKKGAVVTEINLILKFEEFEKNPMGETQRIYTVLLDDDFEAMKPYFKAYIESLAGYKKNKYSVNEASLKKVHHEWKHFLDLYGYKIPDEIEIL